MLIVLGRKLQAFYHCLSVLGRVMGTSHERRCMIHRSTQTQPLLCRFKLWHNFSQSENDVAQVRVNPCLHCVYPKCSSYFVVVDFYYFSKYPLLLPEVEAFLWVRSFCVAPCKRTVHSCPKQVQLYNVFWPVKCERSHVCVISKQKSPELVQSPHLCTLH